MAGAGEEVHCAVAVVLRPLVLIADHHSNWRAQCHTKLCARLDLDSVLLVARGRQGALAGSAAGHLRLDVALGELHARRAAVDDTADGAAVRLAIAGNMLAPEGVAAVARRTW